MNSRLTMVLAGGFLLGAILAAYWGVQLSKTPETASENGQTLDAEAVQAAATLQGKTQQLVDEAQRVSIVVLAKDLAPGHLITADDLRVERLSAAPPESIGEPAEAIGQRVWQALPAGAWLNRRHFELGGPLAKMIHQGERAVAVAIDEVIGAGGHLRPGDFVDVLSISQDGAVAGSRELVSQVVAPALRILTVGPLLGPDTKGQPLEASEETADSTQTHTARTVVLAIPEALATRVALAAQAGQLRLSVRSAEDQLHLRESRDSSVSSQHQRALITQSELTAVNAKPASPPVVVSSAPRNPVPAPRVEVIRAGQSSWHSQ